MADEINTNKQFRLYDKTGQFTRLSIDETIARGLNQWQGWKCSAGVRGLYIDYDGNLWTCNTASAKLDRFNKSEWVKVEFARANGDTKPDTSKVFKRTLHLNDEHRMWGHLGNIETGYELPEKWTTCPFTACGCGADVVLAKASSDANRSLLAVTNDSFDGRTRTHHDYRDHDVGLPAAVEMNFPLPLNILWDLSRFCNYDCNYCWSAVHNRHDPHKEFSLLKQVSDDLITCWGKDNMIRWNFGGGEPTLHPMFIDWMAYLKALGQWTLVTTNGSRSPSYWRELIPHLNSVNLSAHFSQINEDRFIQNIEVICQHFDDHNDDHWLEVKLMATPEYFDRALALRERIRALGVIHTPGANNRVKGALSLVPIRSLGDSGKVVEYTPEQLSILSNQ